MQPSFRLLPRAFPSRRVLLPVLALGFFAGTASAPTRVASAPAVPGLKARIRAQLKNQRTVQLLILDGTFMAHKGRLDVRGYSETAEVRPEEYLLLGDSTTRVINTLDMTFRDQPPYSIGSLVDMVTAIDRGTNVTNPSVKWTDMGKDSLRILKDTTKWLPVRHYQFDVEYGLPGQQGGAAAITRAKGEYWLADLRVNFYNPFCGLARPKSSSGITGDQAPAIVQLYNALKLLQVGTVVKFKASGIIGEGNMNPTIYARTMDVNNIEDVQVDETLFDMPQGYTTVAGANRGGGAPGRGGGGGGGGGGRGNRGGGRGGDSTATRPDSTGRGRAGSDTTGRGRGRDTTTTGRGRGGDTTTFSLPLHPERPS